MSDFTMPLVLDLDVVSLTMSLVNIASPTGEEGGLADSIQDALAPLAHLSVERVGTTVVARTAEPDDAADRVLVAGHLDTVAGAPDAFAYVEMGRLVGPGACDAKGGIAVMLKAAASPHPRNATFVFYDGAETGRDGLTQLAESRPDLVTVDAAVVLEPTAGRVSTTEPTHPVLARLVELADAPGPPAVPLSCSGAQALAARGIPTAVFGPGDPRLAHSPDELVPTAELTQCEHVLRTWLQG
ncbi:M20/M25/M40 family metallo-hydrolase [Nocardioides conyzicola]|uniref:M20/M25/M40 family metallo-hydrolase n=1 Tax=Nocardioides conyzicola TaxID=1651781 RepID=A0ABP8Y1G8_9ACTN